MFQDRNGDISIPRKDGSLNHIYMGLRWDNILWQADFNLSQLLVFIFVV